MRIVVYILHFKLFYITSHFIFSMPLVEGVIFFYFRYVDNNQVRLQRSLLNLQKYFVIFSNFFAISETYSQDNLALSSIIVTIKRENVVTYKPFKFF